MSLLTNEATLDSQPVVGKLFATLVVDFLLRRCRAYLLLLKSESFYLAKPRGKSVTSYHDNLPFGTC